MLTEKVRRPAKGQKEQFHNDVIARLEAAAEASSDYDVAPFVTVYREIDWSERPAEDYVRAVRLALNTGAHLVARNLALQGAERYPDDAELQKMAYVLAPPKVTVSKEPANPGIKADRDWLQANWDSYKGHWVALRNGELLGVGDSLDDLVKQVGEIKNKGILVTPLW